MTPEQVANMQPMRWIIPNILPAHGLVAVFGPSGSAKSSLMLDASFSIASGSDWFGKPTKQSPVIYCALEGTGGFGARVDAHLKHKRQAPDNISIVYDPLDLRDESNTFEFAMLLLRKNIEGGVVIVDTLNASSVGVDENSSKDMGTLIKGAKILMELAKCVVILIHHTGKDSSKGLRGHSSLHAALDVAIEVKRHSNCNEWEIVKSRDGADGESHLFNVEPVVIGTDEFGGDRTSCIIIPAPPESRKKSSFNLSGNQGVVFDTALRLINEAKSMSKDISDNTGVKVKWLDVVSASIGLVQSSEPERCKDRVNTALKSLIKKDLLKTDGYWIWL